MAKPRQTHLLMLGDIPDGEESRPGDQSYATVLHEFMHVFGLADTSFNFHVPRHLDTQELTVLSYALLRTPSTGAPRYSANRMHSVFGLSAIDGAALEAVARRVDPGAAAAGLIRLGKNPGDTAYRVRQDGGVDVCEAGASSCEHIMPSRAGYVWAAAYDSGGRDRLELEMAAHPTWTDLRPRRGVRYADGRLAHDGRGHANASNPAQPAPRHYVKYNLMFPYFPVLRPDLEIEDVAGSPHADHVIGSVHDNMVDLGAGEDEFQGGAGRDSMVFGRGYGKASFRDFNPAEDLLLLDTSLGVGSAEEVRQLAVRDGAGLRIDFPGGDSLHLPSVGDAWALVADCLRFGAGLARYAPYADGPDPAAARP